MDLDFIRYFKKKCTQCRKITEIKESSDICDKCKTINWLNTGKSD